MTVEQEGTKAPESSYLTLKEKKINQCTYCPKKFFKPSALRAHNYTHTGEKPHPCQFLGCNRRFSLLSNLRRHIKTHARTPKKRLGQPAPYGATRKIKPLVPSPFTCSKSDQPPDSRY